MPLETATWIADLVPTNPLGGDPVSQGDDHLRLLKSVLQTTFPSAGRSFQFPSARTITANVTLTAEDNFTLFRANTTSNDIVITLPHADEMPDGYMVVTQKASDAHTLFFNQGGADTINGSAADIQITGEESWMWAWRVSATGWNVLQGSAEGIVDNSVTNTKLADMPEATIKGRTAGTGTGDPVNLSGAAAADILPIFSTDRGLVPGATALEASEGRVLRADASWVLAGAGAPDGLLVEQQAVGTAGGSLNSGVWTVRTLQTVKRNVGSFITLAADEFTIPAGTYYVEWDAPAFGVDGHISRLWNDSDSTLVAVGSPGHSAAGNPTQGWSSGQAVFTLAAAKQLRIETRVETSRATNGGGRPATLIEVETYTKVRIWRV